MDWRRGRSRRTYPARITRSISAAIGKMIILSLVAHTQILASSSTRKWGSFGVRISAVFVNHKRYTFMLANTESMSSANSNDGL